ncbi:MAG: hypothetical protein WCP77_08825, partial [Roseococcus sp.]
MTSRNHHHLSTLQLRPDDQFAAWCSWFDPVFDVVTPASGAAAGFAAEARIWRLGPAALGRVHAPRIHTARTRQNLRRDPVDHWNIIVGRADTRLAHGGKARIIPGGTPFVISLGELMESERDADERLQLYLPRDHFSSLASVLDRVRGAPLDGPQALLLAGYLRLLDKTIPDLAPAALERLPAAIQAMLEACFMPSASDMDAARVQTDLMRLDRIRQAIRRHIHRATLNAASLCREVGMSRSNLYRLLE